jgi:GNAT superfamily N-acetyltransferase
VERLELEGVAGLRGAAEAGAMLARTFHDDPFVVYALPEPETRPEALTAVFTWNVSYGQLYGRSWRTPGKLDGVAVFLPPSPEQFSDERLAATGYQRIAQAVGPEAWPDVHERYLSVFGHCDAAVRAVVPEDYGCLDVIGVELDRRGNGIGSAMIDFLHDPYGRGGPGSYLLTFRPGNVPFYERNGYEVVIAGVEPSSGLEFWGMARLPRPRRAHRPHSA